MIVISLLGLVVPGYAIARALGLPFAAAAAFPMSALAIALAVIGHACVGAPIRFLTVLACLVAASLVAVWFGRPSRSTSGDDPGARVAPALRIVTLVVVAAVLGLFLLRTALYPLAGLDTLWRWEGLARLLFEHETLAFYPPLTPDDFARYPFPDAMAPLVASVYWWLYAGWGGVWPALTCVPVFLQAASCLALAFRTSEALFGRPAAFATLAALATSSLFLYSVAIGQDTGYTALGVAGQLACAVWTGREPRARTAIAAGLFAGLAALARDYGPLLAAAGLVALLWQSASRRLVPLFLVVAAACAAPWYLRTFLVTGNPVYPLGYAWGWPTNPVYAEMLETYRRIFSVEGLRWNEWVNLDVALLTGAPLAVLIGLVSILLARFRAGIVAGAVIVPILIWLASIPYTAAGPESSLRVLTPALVALAVLAGAIGPRLVAGSSWATPATWIVGVCGGYAILLGAIYPFPVVEVPLDVSSVLRAMTTGRAEPIDSFRGLPAVDGLEASREPTAGVLTDSFYLAVALRDRTRFRPVPIWSPEVRFVFNPDAPVRDVRQRLIVGGIRFVSLSAVSANNEFLVRYPFYREDWQQWRPIAVAPDADAILGLAAPSPAAPP